MPPEAETRAAEIRDHLVTLERRIVAACDRADRPRHEVLLVAVTKTFPASDVAHALAAGITDVGENKVQEARDKRPQVAAAARWHLIGHLQSNKAKDAVRTFDVIQSVDSLALAEKLARAAEGAGKVQQVLLQVNVAREPQKSGADPDDLDALVKGVRALDPLELTGLMVIPPAGDPEDARRWFRELGAMRDAHGLRELSMGMTDDFEVAIEEGATIVRVGRAVFGTR
jgi:pyridoxal phosphate enzyme (YggS family)